jgi:hypothetical protein
MTSKIASRFLLFNERQGIKIKLSNSEKSTLIDNLVQNRGQTMA